MRGDVEQRRQRDALTWIHKEHWTASASFAYLVYILAVHFTPGICFRPFAFPQNTPSTYLSTKE